MFNLSQTLKVMRQNLRLAVFNSLLINPSLSPTKRAPHESPEPFQYSYYHTNIFISIQNHPATSNANSPKMNENNIKC